MRTPDSVTLNNCDREPIHIPGTIQAHGCLLAGDVGFSFIKRHSANAGAILGLQQVELNGGKPADLLGEEATHAIRNALMQSNDPSRPGLLTALRIGAKQFNVAAQRYRGDAIVEFEIADDADSGDPLRLSRSLIARLKGIAATDRMLEQTPRLIRSLLEYDRVMVYRFAHDGSGQVVAEAKRPDLESFLGQHFPASDIPRQARELYLKNTIRVIPDANGKRIDIEGAIDASGEPLDMSFAHLRSVSPIHCEYLRNMGVVGSMSISIIVGGKLWGLIACHHYAPKRLGMTERVAVELFGDYFSLNLEAMHQRERLEAALRARRTLEVLLREAASRDDINAFVRGEVNTFASLLPCDGVGLWVDGTWTAHGSVPPQEAVHSLARFVSSVADGRVWATHQLSSHIPAAVAYAHEASGLLAVPLSQMPRDYLFFFRKEVIETVHWAGDPNKRYDSGPLGDRLTPRTSFAIWKETVERQSAPWTSADRESAEATRTALLEVIMRQTEILSAERRKADVRQKVLNDELNHRVKNILALIKSLVSQTTEKSASLEQYVASLKGRIVALSFAHDQIARGDSGGNLRQLLDAELGPYRGGGRAVILDGPDIALDARAYSVMALVLHEMSTNATKYGALSVNGGKLDVCWLLTPDGDCELSWQEAGGPEVIPPRRRGFGSVLIDRSVPYDLGGKSDVEFARGGLHAQFLIPARFVAAAAAVPAAPAGPGDMHQVEECALAGLDILLVEDQLVIALEVEGVLAANGARQVLTAATSEEALRILADTKPSLAVLDVNLGIGTSIPVARELKRRQIAFVFATGYGDTSQIPADLKSQPIVRKPYDAASLLAAIALLER